MVAVGTWCFASFQVVLSRHLRCGKCRWDSSSCHILVPTAVWKETGSAISVLGSIGPHPVERECGVGDRGSALQYLGRNCGQSLAKVINRVPNLKRSYAPCVQRVECLSHSAFMTHFLKRGRKQGVESRLEQKADVSCWLLHELSDVTVCFRRGTGWPQIVYQAFFTVRNRNSARFLRVLHEGSSVAYGLVGTVMLCQYRLRLLARHVVVPP